MKEITFVPHIVSCSIGKVFRFHAHIFRNSAICMHLRSVLPFAASGMCKAKNIFHFPNTPALCRKVKKSAACIGAFLVFPFFFFLIIYARCPHKAAGKTQSAAAAGRGGRDPCSYPIGDPGSPSRVPGTGGRPFFRRRSPHRAGFAAQTLAGRIRFPFAPRTTRSGRAGSGNPALPRGCAARRLCTEKSLPCPAPNPMPALFHTVRGPHARAGGALRRWVGRYAKADIRHTRPLF